MKLSRNLKNDAFARSSTSLLGFSKIDALAAIAAAALLLIILGSYSVATPTTKQAQAKIPYSQSGTFNYSASVSQNSIYGKSTLSTGDPVLLKQVPYLTVGFKYAFSGTGTSILSGTEQLRAVVDDNGITRSIPLQAEPVQVSGSTFTATGILDTSRLQSVADAFATAFASVGSQMTVQIVPTIKMKGSLSGRPLDASFDPPLTFSLASSVLQLANPANSNSVTGLDQTKTQLTQTSQGAVTYPTLVSTTLPFGWVHPTVTSGRLIALFGLVACLIAASLILWPLKRADDEESVMIDARYGPRLINVEKVSFRGSAIVTTQSVAVLVTLANKYNTKVLHSIENGNDRYAVFDNGVLYQYECPIQAAVETGLKTAADRIAPGEVILDGLATE